MAKFNKGDKVRIIANDGGLEYEKYVGQTREIVELHSDLDNYYRLEGIYANLGLAWWSDDELELANEPTIPKEFKVGDEVTIVKATGINQKYKEKYIGKSFVITKIDWEDGFVFHDKSCGIFVYYPEELELTKKPSDDTMTYEEALKLAVDGTKVCIVNHCISESHVFFDKDKGKFMWYSGLFNSNSELHGCQADRWKVWVKPEPPKPNPKFQPKQFVANATGDIGIIAEYTGYHGNIPEYSVRFNGVTEKTKPVLETELSEVVL